MSDAEFVRNLFALLTIAITAFALLVVLWPRYKDKSATRVRPKSSDENLANGNGAKSHPYYCVACGSKGLVYHGMLRTLKCPSCGHSVPMTGLEVRRRNVP